MIRVLFFGMLAGRTGTRETEVAPRPGLTLSGVLEELRERYDLPEGPFVLAVNREQAAPETALEDGDEVAVMPPFSGG